MTNSYTVQIERIAYENTIVAYKQKFFLGRVETIAGKGENTGYQHFLLILGMWFNPGYQHFLLFHTVLKTLFFFKGC